jgi:hypothetical protein
MRRTSRPSYHKLNGLHDRPSMVRLTDIDRLLDAERCEWRIEIIVRFHLIQKLLVGATLLLAILFRVKFPRTRFAEVNAPSCVPRSHCAQLGWFLQSECKTSDARRCSHTRGEENAALSSF